MTAGIGVVWMMSCFENGLRRYQFIALSDLSLGFSEAEMNGRCALNGGYWFRCPATWRDLPGKIGL